MLMRSDRLFQAPHVFAGLVRNGYRVILTDPAWKFAAGPSRNPSNHYNRSVADTRASASSRGAPGTVGAFQVVTPGHRRHQNVRFQLLHRPPVAEAAKHEDEAGPFYPTSFAAGTGYEIKNSSELQIIAKIGRPERLGGKSGKKLLHGHVIAPRREHSRKPDCVRDELVSLLEGPRCELFARSTHPGFDAWGDQVEAQQAWLLKIFRRLGGGRLGGGRP